jgi:hypothetical protein
MFSEGFWQGCQERRERKREREGERERDEGNNFLYKTH